MDLMEKNVINICYFDIINYENGGGGGGVLCCLCYLIFIIKPILAVFLVMKYLIKWAELY